jgi:hypothetical protein
MKKIIIFCLGLLVISSASRAQVESETLTIKAVKKGEEPKEVMDAVKKDFPVAIVSDLSMLPGKLYGERWSVVMDDKLDGNPPDMYLVTLKEGNDHYKAVYDKLGKIKSSKTVIKQTQLPKEVLNTIQNKYSDWTIVKDLEKITYKDGLTREAFHVEIQKDKMYRHLFLNSDGALIKDVPEKHSK